jgi:hypothetical protein
MASRPPGRHALRPGEVAAVPFEDPPQPDDAAVVVGHGCASGEQQPHLAVELLVEDAARERFVVQGGARGRSAHERSINARVAEPADLAVLDVVQRERFCSHRRPGPPKGAGHPQHGRDGAPDGNGSEVERPRVVQVDPVGEGFLRRQRIGVLRFQPLAVDIEVVQRGGQRRYPVATQCLQHGAQLRMVDGPAAIPALSELA